MPLLKASCSLAQVMGSEGLAVPFHQENAGSYYFWGTRFFLWE